VLGFLDYLLGAGELLAIATAALLAAARVRSSLLPAWTGPPAWLVTAVVALALVVVVAQLLGTVGLFDEAWMIVALVVAAIGARRLPVTAAELAADPPAPDPGRAPRLIGLVMAAVVIAHFVIGVRLRLSTGMTGFDTTWYHAPFAAGFAQSGDTFDIQFIAPQFLAWFYPQNAELFHGLGMVAFGRDLLSPFLNLAWLGGCLLAAWCIGRPFGVGPASLAGVALVLGSGALADQAGEARNDLTATFFVLSAAAIAVNAQSARPERAPATPALAVCALCAGLAAGTKLNFAPAAAVIVAGLCLAAAGQRSRLLGVGVALGLLGGGYWYLRNLVQAGNPLPWIDQVGPLSLPGPDQEIGGRSGHNVLGYLTDGAVWSDWLGPGLKDGFGFLWPLLLALGAAGLAAGAWRRSEPALRLAAAAGLALLVSWLLGPTSASGPEGTPLGFESGLRYLAPALALGLALLPTLPALRGPGRRWAVLAAVAILLPFTAASGTPWYSGYLLAAVLAGAAFAAAAAALMWPPVRRLGVAPALAVSAAAVLVAIAAGDRVQRTYLDNRYAKPEFTVPGLDAAFAWARTISDARIATTGTRQYPLFGTDLSNRVQFVGVERPHAGFVRPPDCRSWRRAVNAGDFDYVVATLDRFQPGRPPYPSEAAWTAGDPAARPVLRKPPTVVFELEDRLDPSGCP
jgi:hypothetical protein